MLLFRPIHGWLVDAYPEGTITGSVFLSSFTTKVAVYCLIRMFAGTEWLMWVGVVMALYGACFAIIENDMRRLLAYHIVSQVGFMVAGVGIGTDLALNGQLPMRSAIFCINPCCSCAQAL